MRSEIKPQASARFDIAGGYRFSHLILIIGERVDPPPILSVFRFLLQNTTNVHVLSKYIQNFIYISLFILYIPSWKLIETNALIKAPDPRSKIRHPRKFSLISFCLASLTWSDRNTGSLAYGTNWCQVTPLIPECVVVSSSRSIIESLAPATLSRTHACNRSLSEKEHQRWFIANDGRGGKRIVDEQGAAGKKFACVSD